ncbi:hypothetical protein [Paenibacillus sp. NFR01]|uniref:hypothetical protein n=1 Tax=Paenibacillus sp. NFR01 TaxID=1566279 RepID=UPI0008BD0F2C|nr:hypothetical protein [Paenibacillus sp. NFR01]SEU32510.1 hypothetical protein SAMN03159358_0131 [Paenibacillus sp. NFR01]
MNQNTERELGWEDTIQKDGGEFTLLPAGDYNFTITKFERGRFAGSDKMPACNEAKLELSVHSPEHGDVVVIHRLFLHTKTEGLLSNFFAGIGQKRKGEPLRMNWNAVVGARGRLKLEVNKFKGRDGEDKTNNQVKSFYPADEPSTTSQPQQQYGQPQGYQHQTPFPTTPPPQGGNWSNGQF